MPEKSAIQVRDLSFGYGDALLLDHVSFDVRHGDFAAIIGSNGTGKSTMIKLLLGLLSPIRGDIQFFGESLTHAKDLADIGYVPQNSGNSAASFPATVEEIVLTGLYKKIGFLSPARKKHRELVIASLDAVGLQKYRTSLMSELSGGQQQRVMLARVLVNRPKILLLDEPTVGIDVGSVKSLLEILHKLNIEHQVTIVMVTHDLEAVAPYLSRIFCLSDHNFAENHIPEGVLVHAHPPHEPAEPQHIHCAACEGGPHDPSACEACVHWAKEGENHV